MKRNISILIIEDNEVDVELCKRFIKKAGYTASFLRVETVEELNTALTNQTWDLVLADYQLPNLNAPTALKIFKSFNLNIPFILISGAIGEETAVDLIKAGAQDFVMKDNLERLSLVIKHEMQEARLREEALAITSTEGNYSFFRSNLQYLLETNNLKQAQLARDVGISKQTLSDWLRRDSLINIQQAVKIAKYFKITTDDLVTNDLRTIKILDSFGNFESLNKLRAPLYIVGPEGVVQFANQSFCDLLGFNQQDLSNRVIFEIIHPESCLHLDVLKNKSHENKVMSSEVDVRYVETGTGFKWIHHLVVRSFIDNKIFIFATPINNQKSEKLSFLSYSLEQIVTHGLSRLQSLQSFKKDIELVNKLDLKIQIRTDVNIFGCLLRSMLIQINQVEFENVKKLKVVLNLKDEKEHVFLSADIACAAKFKGPELTRTNKIADMINAKVFESYNDNSYSFTIAFIK